MSITYFRFRTAKPLPHCGRLYYERGRDTGSVYSQHSLEHERRAHEGIDSRWAQINNILSRSSGKAMSEQANLCVSSAMESRGRHSILLYAGTAGTIDETPTCCCKKPCFGLFRYPNARPCF